MSAGKLRQAWYGIRQRCYNENIEAYKRYGGRGIKVCDEWLNDHEAFETWAMANGYEDGLTLDRIDNDGDYCPENCRWATYGQQNSNRRNSVKAVVDGVEYTVAELSEKSGISKDVLYARIRKGIQGDGLVAPTRKNVRHLVTIGDETKPITEWCKEFDVSWDTVKQRMRNGMSDVDALLKPCVARFNPDRGKVARYEAPDVSDVDFSAHTLREWAEITGIKYSTLSARIRAGWDPRLAVSVPTGKSYDGSMRDV